MFIGYKDDNWSNIWTTESFKNYQKFLCINFGLNGALIDITPRQLIEGYDDPLLKLLNEMPVYEGGDQTRSSFFALDMPVTHPVNNSITFMTGYDDSELTRGYTKWNNSTDLWIDANDYESLHVIIPAPFKPWAEASAEEIIGTDGF